MATAADTPTARRRCERRLRPVLQHGAGQGIARLEPLVGSARFRVGEQGHGVSVHVPALDYIDETTTFPPFLHIPLAVAK